jgi:hypothetical protein
MSTSDPPPGRRRDPDPDDPGEHGIQSDAPLPRPAPQPEDEDEPILLSEEHIRAAAPVPVHPPAEVSRSRELIDQEFDVPLGRQWGAFLLAVLCVSVLTTAVAAQGGRLATVIAVPIAGLVLLGLGLLLLRPRRRRLRFAEEGIWLDNPEFELAYDQILEVFAPDRRKRGGRNFPIHLLQPLGYFTIPAGVRADSEEIYHFLRTQPLGVRDLPSVDPILRDFVKQQVTVHGANEIHVYRARMTTQPLVTSRAAVWVCVAMLLAGLMLVPIGLLGRRNPEVWVTVGLVMALLGGLFSLLALVQRNVPRAPIKHWQKATLVIAPDGLALVQGNLKGELRWRELRGVKMGKGAVMTAGGQGAVRIPGIHLQVEGAAITIADIYHWPLSHALEQIERHWRG